MIRSNPPITVSTSTLAVTRHLHDNRPILLNLSAGIAVTLPRATGTGARFFFEVLTASNANTISGGTAAGAYNSTFFGGVSQNDTGDTSPATNDFFPAASGNNTYSPTTVGGGGAVGDWIEFVDIATDKYLVSGQGTVAVDPSNRFSTV